MKRSADTQTEAEQFPTEDAQQEDSESIDETDIVENPLIPHETFSRTWSTKIANPHAGAGLTFSKRFLGMIGSLTGCRVELEPDGKTVTAKGENNEDINKAIAKLDVVDRWAVSLSFLQHQSWLMMQNEKQSCPLMFDFQYSEGEIGIMLQMKMLKDLKDRRLITTLVPTDFRSIKNLGSYLTVVMIKQGLEITVDQGGHISKQYTLWKDHVFKFREDGSSDPPKEDFTPPSSTVSSTPLANESPPEQAGIVDKWVEHSASGVLENPFSPPVITKEYRGSVHEAIVQPPVERPAPPPRKRFAKSRKPLGVEVQAQVPVKDDPAESITAISHEIPANAESDTVSNENQGSERSESAKGTASEDGVSRMLGPRIGLQSSPSNKQRLDAPPIEPPYMPIETNAATPSEYGGSDSSWEKQLVNKGRAGKLIDDSLPRYIIKDRVQPTDEVQTRQFRRTMNQRKSASSAGNFNSSFGELLRNLEQATTTILKLAHNSQGPVRLSVEIGRILINHLSGSAEYKKKAFRVEEWPLVFPIKKGTSELESLFTNMYVATSYDLRLWNTDFLRLTMSSSDVQFVLALKKHSEGRKLFTEVPAERKATYCFKCSTTTEDRV